MKLILLTLLSLVALPVSSSAQVQIKWESIKLCDTCKPSFAYSSSHENISVIAQPLDRFDGYDHQRDFRTTNGGGSWSVFKDSIRFFPYDRQSEDYYFLDAARYFRRGQSAIGFSRDSGRNWINRQSYPIPFRFYMSSEEVGIGLIRDTLNGENTIDLRGTTDSTIYWYDRFGSVYSTPLIAFDAQFLSDSEVVVLFMPKEPEGPSAVVMTSNKGKSWEEVLSFPAGDSTYLRNVTTVRNSDVLLIEAYGDNALFLSRDRGSTWQAVANDLDLASSRTRASAVVGQPLLLWAAKTADRWGPIDNLLEPWSSPPVYPSKILLSMDTGSTWSEQDFYPAGLDSVQIFDIIPDGDKIYVVSYLDSTTYVSTATISGFGSVKSDDVTTPMINLYPNPASGHAALSLEDSRIHVTSFVVVDALGSRRATGSVEEGRLELSPSRLSAGSYTVLLYRQGNQVAQAKLIVQ